MCVYVCTQTVIILLYIQPIRIIITMHITEHWVVHLMWDIHRFKKYLCF